MPYKYAKSIRQNMSLGKIFSLRRSLSYPRISFAMDKVLTLPV